MGKAARIHRRWVAAAALCAVAAIVAPHAHAALTGTYEKGPVQPVRTTNEQRVDFARGAVTGLSVVHKFGKNSAVGAGTTEDIWGPGGTILFSSQPARVRIAAGGNAADDPLGAGAATITVVGLNSDWRETSEVLFTSGTAASPLTTGHFLRVYMAYISTMGASASYVTPAANTGAVTVQTSSGNTVALIAAGYGQTQSSLFTVSKGSTCYIIEISISVSANKPADVFLWQRPAAWDSTSAPYAGSKRLVWSVDAVSTPVNHIFEAPVPLYEMTDIWSSATAAAGSDTAVSVDYDLICRNNTTP